MSAIRKDRKYPWNWKPFEALRGTGLDDPMKVNTRFVFIKGSLFGVVMISPQFMEHPMKKGESPLAIEFFIGKERYEKTKSFWTTKEVFQPSEKEIEARIVCTGWLERVAEMSLDQPDPGDPVSFIKECSNSKQDLGSAEGLAQQQTSARAAGSQGTELASKPTRAEPSKGSPRVGGQ